MITPQEVNQAFDLLKRAQTNLAECSKSQASCAERLERAKATLLADGTTIDGKNAEMREAQLREQLAVFYADVALANSLVTDAKANHTIALMEVDRCKTLLQLLTLAPRRSRPDTAGSEQLN